MTVCIKIKSSVKSNKYTNITCGHLKTQSFTTSDLDDSPD